MIAVVVSVGFRGFVNKRVSQVDLVLRVGKSVGCGSGEGKGFLLGSGLGLG